SKRGVERLIAERFPRTGLPALLSPILRTPTQFAPGQIETHVAEPSGVPERPTPVEPLAAQPILIAAPPVPAPRPRLTPIAPTRVAMQLTVSAETEVLIREVQELAAHGSSRPELEDLVHEAFALLARDLRKRRFAECEAPRPNRERRSDDPRHVAS